MSRSWFSKLRDRDDDWAADSAADTLASGPDPFADEVAPSAHAGWGIWLVRGLLAAAGIAWFGIVAWSFADPTIGLRLSPFLEIVSRLSVPLVLVVGLALLVMMLAGHWDNDESKGRMSAEDARAYAAQAAQAAARIGEAHTQLLGHTKSYAAAADRSATALLEAVTQMSERGDRLAEATGRSIATLESLSARMAAFDSSAPQFERRLSELVETMACLGVELRERSTHLETRLKEATTAARDTRTQLIAAGDSLNDRLGTLRDGAKAAGEELASLAELSSARIDFTLDRVRTVLDATEQRIDTQNQALTALVERSRESIETASEQSLALFLSRCGEIEDILDRLDGRIAAQSEKGGAWLEAASAGAAALGRQFDALEQSALGRTERLGAAMVQLSGETRRLVDALDAGDQSSEQLITRAEALLLALDSGVRELDESVPRAIGRVEERLDAMRQRIAEAGPAVESVEARASAVVGRMEEAGKFGAEHAAGLDAALTRAQAALAGQKEQIAALCGAIDQASEGMTRLGDTVGPQMIEALLRVRETADAAAKKAHEAIMATIPQAATALGEASSDSLARAASAAVDGQIARLTEAADRAVQTAGEAAARLDAQLKALHETSEALERRLTGSTERLESQDRELLTRRSGELIEMLNSRAIDVSKWLGHDISEGEWAAYLKGDQGIFARRAVRMLSRTEARAIQALYREDSDFGEHVNRYVHDFEALLKGVLAARDGSALAVTMLSSDLGKLYVALAQASDRLRAG